MWMWQETLLEKIVKFRVNLKFFAPWLPWQRPPSWIFSTPKGATHYGGYSYKVSWSLMKGIQFYFKSPLFCFYGNCSKVCPTDSDFSGLSPSTRCGCCSYQVSSISVPSYDVSWSLMKEIKKKIKIPPFLFPWQLRQSLSYRFRFFCLSRSTRCGCDRTHYCKNLWSLEWI
jgi:hypothetical protein